MKSSFILLFFHFVTTKSETIVIKTQSNDKVYSFLPFNCNYLEFLGMANNDMHITLTRSPTYQPPSYEIVIGGWENTKSALRKDTTSEVATSNQTLRAGQFGRYWISTNATTGTIEMGIANRKPFMAYVDEHFIDMSYVGFATGFGTEGNFQVNLKDLTCNQIKVACTCNSIIAV